MNIIYKIIFYNRNLYVFDLYVVLNIYILWYVLFLNLILNKICTSKRKKY